MEYYDGYGYNFYTMDYGYYEYSCAPIARAQYSIAQLMWSLTCLIIISAASFFYFKKTENKTVCLACCFPWGLTALIGVAIVLPFAITGGVLYLLGAGCLICMDKCAVIAGNVKIDLAPDAPVVYNLNQNITNTNITNVS